MKDYAKLSDLNDLDKHSKNPHSFFNDLTQNDPFYLNSPSSLKTLDSKQKLATIEELPARQKSKSTTEIPSNAQKMFEDNFQIKSNECEDTSASVGELGYNMRKANSNGGRMKRTNPDKTNFFADNHNRESSTNVSSINHHQHSEDPFLIKTPEIKDKKKHYHHNHRQTPLELAVDIRNVNYQYGYGSSAIKVLNDISVKVPLGGIYGLLGPSGCGKTSLLKLVLGMNYPDQGCVRVFGSSPGTKNAFIPGPGVGYMPQDISLFSELTVAETLVFYSKIYRMKSHLVANRIEFLLKLLALDHKGNRLVRQLSGGQKRRVSLAAALVHSPPLVILDEPTVGVDPLLRQQIWEYLVKLADEASLTVIITTHYIEEARQAGTVGLMRFGRMLVEENPERLMIKYKRNNLEDVFLNLCMLDEKDIPNSDTESSSTSTGGSDQYSQIKFEPDAVRYSVGSNTNPNEEAERNSNDLNDIPRVLVTDHSLPLSPHMVREKENENFNQGSIYANQLENGTLPKTPAPQKNFASSFNKMRSPLTALNHEETFKEDNQNHLQVQTGGRERMDSVSSLGSSIIEYDSICSRESKQTPVKLAAFKQEFKHMFESKLTVRNKFRASFLKIGALSYKNITLLLRNIPLLLFQFLLPSLEIILFGICIGADPFNLNIAIFNQDTSGNLPQLFLNSIDNHTVTQVHYSTLPEAIDAVRQGNAWGAIAFKQNFSVALGERQFMSLNAENETIDHSSVYIFLDMTNQLIGYKLQRTFLETLKKFSRDLMIRMDANPKSVELPIKIGKPIYGDKEPTFTEFMAPGVVLTIAFLATVALTALAFVLERKDGIMERVLVSGVTPFEFLMSHIVTQLCVIVVQVALLLIFTFLVFDIPSRGPFIWVILLTMAQAICGMEYGLLISSLCESETAATMMALGSFYPNLLLSGTVWPTQAMPTVMRYFSYTLPQTIPIETMRYILSRGWDPINHNEVLLGFLVTIAWTIIFMVATMIAFKRIH